MRLTKPGADRILSKWGLKADKLRKFENEGGYVNENWLFRCKDENYVLRKVTFFDAEELSFDMEYMLALRKYLPYEMPVPIRNKRNRYFERHGNKIFWIYRYVEGEKKTNHSIKEVLEYARVLGTYHKLLLRLKLHGKRDDSDPFRIKAVGNSIKADVRRRSKRKGKRPFEVIYLKWAARLLPLYKRLDKERYLSLDFYPIHGDIDSDNVLWKEDKISAILDFEHVYYEKPFIRDLIVPIFRYCKNGNMPWALDLNKTVIFLKEYSKFRKLGRGEIAEIPDVLVANYIEDFDYSFSLIKKPHYPKQGVKDGTEYIVQMAKGALWCDRNRELIRKRLLKSLH